MSRDLNDLSSLVRPKIDDFINKVQIANIDMLVTCTSRTMTEQAALWAKGRDLQGNVIDRSLVVTNAKPGESAHNYRLAIDIVPIVNGKPDWRGTDPVWLDIGEIGESCGLEWAGRWVTFREEPHFQLPNWQNFIQGIVPPP
jgi:peptidoglycan LD-endopeptidase CwlK